MRRRTFLARALKVAASTASTAGTAGALVAGACGTSRSPTARRLKSVRGGGVRSGVQGFRTRPDLQPPQIVVRRRPREPGSPFIFTESHGGPGQQGPMMIDRTGRLAWFKALSAEATPSLRAFNVRVQTYRGKSVLTWWEGAIVSAHGQGHYVLYDDRYQQIAKVQAGNGYLGDLHEFVLTPQGTALLTCYAEGTDELPVPNGAAGTQPRAYFYGVVQEVDVATGEVLFSGAATTTSTSPTPIASRPKTPTCPGTTSTSTRSPSIRLTVSC